MFVTALAQQTIPLYQGEIPNSKPSAVEEQVEFRDGIVIVSKISQPSLSIYLPPKEEASGTAVIICPGGGYRINALSHEGTDVARVFQKMGVAAFVLKYRVPDENTMVNREIGPLQDAQQAIRVVRLRAAEWGVNPERIGIMGFSAGGHLASTAATHFTLPVTPNPEKINVRPDFSILIYPVISFNESICHMGSREQLIGKQPTAEKIKNYSNELQVTAQTPPTFLVHSSDDETVKSENSLVFYQALVKHKIPAEMHLYPGGGHGYGMNNPTTEDLWMDRCRNWMKANGWIKAVGNKQ
jgi:acetyl esterase/lipase